MKKLSVGFLGAGWVVEHVYLPFFAHHPCVSTLLAHDVRAERLESLGRRFPNLQLTSELSDVCCEAGPDLVVVASPNHLHLEHVVGALNTGRRVLCEKPICISAREARTMEEELTRTGGIVDPCLPNRFREDVAHVRRIVQEGRLGQVHRVSARWLRRRGVPGGAPWHLHRHQAGGGVLMDLGAHLLDVVLWICGYPKPREIDCATSDRFIRDPLRLAEWYGGGRAAPTRGAIDVEDSASVLLGFDGLSCSLHFAWAGPYAHDTTEIDVHGETGRLQLKSLFGFSPDTALTRTEVRVWDSVGESHTAFALEPRRAPFDAMLEAVIHDVMRSGDGIIDPAEPLAVVRMIDAAYRSARVDARRDPISMRRQVG